MTTSAEPQGLHDQTGYWINRLRSEAHRAFERRLGEHGVTVAQYGVLIALARGAATSPLELALFIDVDGGAMTRLLDRLIAKGLITRAASPHDRRSVVLGLTDHARALMPRLAAAADAYEQACTGALSAAECAEFKRLLAKQLQARGVAPPADWLASGPASLVATGA